jgi:hypothetical protein
LAKVRIGVDDSLQLSFLGAVPPIAVRVVAADEAFVAAPDVAGGGAIAQPERLERLGIAETSPILGGGPGRRIATEQIVRIAEPEGRATARGGCPLPPGQRRLCLADLVGAEAVEEVIAGVEGADMVEAQELPAAVLPGQAVRQRRAELAGGGTAGVVAPLVAVDPAVQTLRALGCVGGDCGESLA